MQYEVDASPKMKKFIEILLPSMFKQLKLNKSKKFLSIKVERDHEAAGSMIPFTGIDHYLVILKYNPNYDQLGTSLAHELVHVAQYAKGILKCTEKGRKWRGKFYHNDHPYLDQPWEVQAFSKQELILRRALEE